MSTAPRLAVVIPCRNDAPMLDACLRALAVQTRRPDRVIVVDNGSSDESAAIAAAHGADVLTEPRVGVWPAAARGYDEAARTADIIARMDADSRPHPDWTERVLRSFADAPDVGAVTGAAEFYGAGPVKRYLGEKWYIGGMYFWVTPWLGHPPVFGSNFAMRASLWRDVRDRVDRTNAAIHDDLDLSIRLRRSDGIRYDPELRMPISARPLATPAALWRRVGKVVPTFAASWPEGAAWNRADFRSPFEEGGDEWLIDGVGR